MAKGNPHPPKEYQFKPGKSGNPGGKPVETEEQKRLRRLTKAELAECASWLVKGNIDQIRAIVKDPKASILQVWVASLVIKSIEKGDADSWDKVMNRIVGKVKDELSVEGNAVRVNITLPKNGFEPKNEA
jgi:hypothetical protein